MSLSPSRYLGAGHGLLASLPVPDCCGCGWIEMSNTIKWLISVGDAASQLVGRLIPVRVGGKWHTWTDSANESISGAAYRWEGNGHFSWVRWLIDTIFWPVESDHCRKSDKNDTERAIEHLAKRGYEVRKRAYYAGLDRGL